MIERVQAGESQRAELEASGALKRIERVVAEVAVVLRGLEPEPAHRGWIELVDEMAAIKDKLPGSADAGAAVAEDLGCRRVVLSNFPGGYEDTATWEDTIDYNVQLLLAALSE